MPEHLLIATAGHVDHGKSTLVRMLTGMDPDRWQEEKDRGITIDLGYAHRLEGQRQYSFVDVPGHERFIHNMLAGVGCIDGVLFVVAADESIMPQTREHALALHYLGCRQVGIIVTKCDLVDADFLDLVHAELDDWLPQFGWQNAPRANCSSTNPESLEAVLELLAKFETKAIEQQTLFRMPIDRVFVSQGSGTIVTGAVDCGSVEKTDSILLLPDRVSSRVRQIQVHGTQTQQASQHQRAALNLADFHHSDVSRGHFLFAPPGAQETQQLLVRLTLFEDWEPSGKHLFHVHHYSKHLMARMVWRKDDYAMFSLDQPHVFWALDKGLIRDGSPLQVTAGFQVIHPAPSTSRRKHTEKWLNCLGTTKTRNQWQAAFLAQTNQIVASDHILQLCGRPIAEELESSLVYFDSQHVMHQQAFDSISQQCLEILDACHARRSAYDFLPLNWVRSCWDEARIPSKLTDFALQQWQRDGQVIAFEDRIKAAQYKPIWKTSEKKQLDQILKLCQRDLPVVDLRDFSSDRSAIDQLIQMLVWEKFLVSLTPDLLLPSAYVNQISAGLAAKFAGQHLQVGDLKDRLQLSRKIAIPLLELFDKLGWTIREQEGRRWLSKTPSPIVFSWQPPA